MNVIDSTSVFFGYDITSTSAGQTYESTSQVLLGPSGQTSKNIIL
jgi:hypothetical protein